MKWTTRLLFLLAISLSVAVIAMVSTQRNRTPGATLDSIEAALTRDDYNHSALLRSLGTALTDSQKVGDQALQIRALTLRGDLFLGIGAADEARKDYENIRALMGVADEALLLRLVDADVAAGDPESGQRRIDELLASNPSSARALVHRGRLYLASARQRLDQCNEGLVETLPHDEALLGAELVERLGAQDLLDAHRAGTVALLRDFFPETDGERLSKILVLTDEASLYSRDARTSFEASFAHDIDPVGVYEYITLLIRADQPEKAMRFGAPIRRQPQVQEHHATTLALISAHIDAGDGDGAGTLAAELIQSTRDLTTKDYALCCRALHKAQRWSGLFHAASRMRAIGTSVDGLEAALYLGLAQNGRKRYSNARTLLRSFATSNLPEPYPDARYEAWTTLAGLDKAAEQPFFERESIHAALQISPNATNAAELWERLAELQIESGHTSYKLPLRSYAEAICRSPKGYEALYERFNELGERVLVSEGRDLELIYQELLSERRSLPPIPLDSYSLLELAKRHAKDDNHLAVISVCRRLLDNLPGFLPAIDQMINSRLILGRNRTATEQIVERVGAVGLDKISSGFVRRLPADPYTPSQLHRLMSADPAWTGRLELSRRLREVGDRRAAIQCLDGNRELIDQTPEALFLSAQIHSELGDRPAAMERLNQFNPGDPYHSEAMLLASKIASLMDDTQALDAAATALVAAGDEQDLQTLTDKLLFDRRLERVKPVMDALREISGENDPWILEHEILYRLVRGEVQEAKEAAARAEAFSPSSRPPIGGILASTVGPNPEQLARESTYYLSHFPNASTPVSKAILALFAGDEELAQTIAALNTKAARRAPEWALLAVGAEALGYDLGVDTWGDDEVAHARDLLLGSESAPRKPRTSLGVLLAAQNPFYAPYALEKLNEFTRADRSVWDAYLIANTLHRGGEQERARDAIWTTVQPDSPFFAPAWELFERLELDRLGTLDHQDIDSMRIAKIRSEGSSDTEGGAALLASAYGSLDSGDFEGASDAAQRALEADPTSHEANAALAKIKQASGNYRQSLDYWLAAYEQANDSHLPRYIHGTLTSVERAIAFTPPRIMPSDASGIMESLARFAPTDPRVPLVLAKLDLLQDPENPALGVARAFRRLDNFLRNGDKSGLARAHHGTEEAWIDFYLEYGPAQALSLCRSQLSRTPGALSLWLGEVRALRALGKHEEAIVTGKRLLKMSESAQLHEELAACLQASGEDAKTVEEHLAKAHTLRGETLSVESMLTRTKSLLGIKGERTASQAISALSRVWNPDITGPLSQQDSEVALILAEGFMKRAKGRDNRQAQILLTKVSKHAQDPYARSLASALKGLCAQLGP